MRVRATEGLYLMLSHEREWRPGDTTSVRQSDVQEVIVAIPRTHEQPPVNSGVVSHTSHDLTAGLGSDIGLIWGLFR
jgi:hypothetical protein